MESRRTLEAHLAKLAEFRDKAAAVGKFSDAITAEVARGKALGFYVERRETGKVGEFTAKTRGEADKQLDETIARIAMKQAIERAQKGLEGD